MLAAPTENGVEDAAAPVHLERRGAKDLFAGGIDVEPPRDLVVGHDHGVDGQHDSPWSVQVQQPEKSHEEKTENKGYYRVERSYGSFRRILDVPEDADKDKINAQLKKGVLCITMSRTKTIENNSRKIAVESSTDT